MFPKPLADLTANTAEYERLPLVKPTGFREYDARWLFESESNLMRASPESDLFESNGLIHKTGRLIPLAHFLRV